MQASTRKPSQAVPLGMQGQSQCSCCKLSIKVKLGQNSKYFPVESNEKLGLQQCESIFRYVFIAVPIPVFPNVIQACTEAMKRGHQLAVATSSRVH